MDNVQFKLGPIICSHPSLILILQPKMPQNERVNCIFNLIRANQLNHWYESYQPKLSFTLFRLKIAALHSL